LYIHCGQEIHIHVYPPSIIVPTHLRLTIGYLNWILKILNVTLYGLAADRQEYCFTKDFYGLAVKTGSIALQGFFSFFFSF